MANNGMDMESGSARYLWAQQRNYSLKMMILRIQQTDDQWNSGGRYIIRGVTARNNTISGNCDGIKFSLAEDCSCRGNTVRLSDSHTYNNMGISVAKEAISEFPITIFPEETDMGFMQSEQRLRQKICRIYGNTVSDL
ncbi:MAG: hypothetical protein ACLVB1_10390 [Blautia obeum]